MKKELFLLFIAVAGTASAQSIDARLAAAKRVPMPTFGKVHEAFNRLVVNESGWTSQADVGGILDVHLVNAGGRDRTKRPSTYGLDVRRFIIFTSLVAARTFPADSPWIFPRPGKTHEKWQREYGNSYWTSGLKLDCSEPEHWAETQKAKWANYVDRCKSLVKLTGEYLRGEHESWCKTADGLPAMPRFWGSNQDYDRNPEVRTWEELTCDAPNTDCKKSKGDGCAKNRWFRLPRK